MTVYSFSLVAELASLLCTMAAPSQKAVPAAAVGEEKKPAGRSSAVTSQSNLEAFVEHLRSKHSALKQQSDQNEMWSEFAKQIRMASLVRV